VIVGVVDFQPSAVPLGALRGSAPGTDLGIVSRLANLSLSERVVRVEADLSGKVKCDGDARLSLFQQKSISLIRLLGIAKPGILLECPKIVSVSGGVLSSGEGILPGKAEILVIAEMDVFNILRRVQGATRQTRLGNKGFLSLWSSSLLR